MKYFIGVDGGGTKTAFALSGPDGVPRQTLTAAGCSYQELGVEAVADLLWENTRLLLHRAGALPEDCAGCCIGLPCYGENPDMDARVKARLEAAFAPIPVHIVNDVEVGWAGSLEGREGIHVVSGTGAIAFGRGKDGQSGRCGGWDEFYGDEGSCYWLGRRAMGLFSKEADGRMPRGALYEIVRAELDLRQDLDFTQVVRERYAPHRAEVAAFQTLACRAAKAGDPGARALYTEAAQELSLLVKALKEKLIFSSEVVEVSYSGGLFQTGELILEPFRAAVQGLGCRLTPPRRTSTEGALLLAIQKFKK